MFKIYSIFLSTICTITPLQSVLNLAMDPITDHSVDCPADLLQKVKKMIQPEISSAEKNYTQFFFHTITDDHTMFEKDGPTVSDISKKTTDLYYAIRKSMGIKVSTLATEVSTEVKKMATEMGNDMEKLAVAAYDSGQKNLPKMWEWIKEEGGKVLGYTKNVMNYMVQSLPVWWGSLEKTAKEWTGSLKSLVQVSKEKESTPEGSHSLKNAFVSDEHNAVQPDSILSTNTAEHPHTKEYSSESSVAHDVDKGNDYLLEAFGLQPQDNPTQNNNNANFNNSGVKNRDSNKKATSVTTTENNPMD